MYEHFEAERARKKAMTTAEKKEAKAAKDELEGPFAACVLDGRKEKVGNFRVEPPSLFRGRGEHPRKGSLKVSRVMLHRTVRRKADVLLLGLYSFVSIRRTSLSTLPKAFLSRSQTYLETGRRSSTTKR
jgi:hypothetical protein